MNLTTFRSDAIITKHQKSVREWWNWQTRWLQVPVLARACGFNSRLAHQKEGHALRVLLFGFRRTCGSLSLACGFKSTVFAQKRFGIQIRHTSHVGAHCAAATKTSLRTGFCFIRSMAHPFQTPPRCAGLAFERTGLRYVPFYIFWITKAAPVNWR